MARPLSSEQHQALIDLLTKDIRALPWGAGGKKSDLERLANFIGLDLKTTPPQPRQRLKKALQELQAALAIDPSGALRDQPSDALARWIERRCLTVGPDLLVTNERRQSWLNRLRDGQRRARRKARGVRYVNIGLAAVQWDKIHHLGAQLGATTLSDAVAKIVDAFDAAGKFKRAAAGDDRIKAHRTRKEQRPEQQTLLNLDNPSRVTPHKGGKLSPKEKA